jgi:hypothetical protein
MRFVQVRSYAQVDLQALHRIRDRLMRNRTGLMDQARTFCIEYGLAMCTGAGGFHSDIRRHLANEENDLSDAMRAFLTGLLDDLDHLERSIRGTDRQSEHRSLPASGSQRSVRCYISISSSESPLSSFEKILLRRTPKFRGDYHPS